VFPTKPVSITLDELIMKTLKLLAGFGLCLLPVFAFATDPYAAITASISWANVGVDAALVGVALAGVFLILRGIRMLVAFVRR
jgi:hypothetical protein